MSEPLFKIGGVYRNGCGAAIRLAATGHADCLAPEGFAGMQVVECNDFALFQFARLADGRAVVPDVCGDILSLIPGALHLVNGSWEPVEQHYRELVAEVMETVFSPANFSDADERMIARDGPERSKPAVVALPAPPLTTAHKAVKGLTFLSVGDHRFGLGVR